ncbi:MAG TPA: hypothetical protein DEP84_26720 [Chloroflexi bacterium]|nr:hypothetical protein [Chloroflexota bacterium]
MKSKTMIIALCSAAMAWAGMPKRSFGESQIYEVIVTAYTCEENSNNPMHPCGPLRWGGDRYGPGMACPVEWRDRAMDVPGYGIRRCDDTPRDGYLDGLPHIDLRVPTVAEAKRIGVRRMIIQPANGLPSENSGSANALATQADAISLAHTMVADGDVNTAMARLLRTARAREYFPTLLTAVDLPAEHPVWVVTLWVPANEIPEGAVAQPDASAEIAARCFLFDAQSGALVTDAFVSKDVLETLGWLSQDA